MARYTGPKTKIARNLVSLFSDPIKYFPKRTIPRDNTV